MAFATLGGKDVLSGSIRVPRVGVWRAEVTLDADTMASFAGRIALTLGDGAVSWPCTAVRGSIAFGRAELTVLGGAGGLATVLAGQSYVNVPARVPLGDIAGVAGETVSASSSPALLGVQLRAWTRVAGCASTQLATLADAVGATWRVLTDGTLWVGRETWPDAPAIDMHVISEHPKQAMWKLATTQGYLLQPGTTFASAHVDYVQHAIESGGLRTNVWFATA